MSYLGKSYSEIHEAIVADGVIDAVEAKQLRELIYADGKIDREEAEFLFSLNDAVSGKKNDGGWTTLFVEAICDYLLKDDESPGEVDEDEANWLIQKIQRDEQVDELEKALLHMLANKAASMPDNLKQLIESLG